MIYLFRIISKGIDMIKMTGAVFTAVTLLFTIGCSSYPDSADSTAKAVCGTFKAGDLEGAKSYMSASALQQTTDSESVISKFFALPEFKEKAARLDCNTVTKRTSLGQDHEIIYFGGFNTEVQKIDGKWKLIN